MKSWPAPEVPTLVQRAPAVALRDQRTGVRAQVRPDGTARIYVCGITPYDATHLGHAATYLMFDTLRRALQAGGHKVLAAQNITDLDDPLLERAARDGVDWTELAAEQVQLFREDMEALRVLPPEHYVGVVEAMSVIADDVRALVESGAAYPVPTPDASQEGAQDLYLDLARAEGFGTVSRWTREEMLAVFAERGGDPERPGKRDALDPLLWRVERAGEPAYDAPGLERGRPGWHIECTAIATRALGGGFDVQAGGTDLVFPHHEMSACQAAALGGGAFARHYVHQAMVGMDGEKMSKSKGNLVLVSTLREQGVDPMSVRLVVLDHHYASEWSWTDQALKLAQERLTRWREAWTQRMPAPAGWTESLLATVADDLRTPEALSAVDAWASGSAQSSAEPLTSADEVRSVVDAVLGITL